VAETGTQTLGDGEQALDKDERPMQGIDEDERPMQIPIDEDRARPRRRWPSDGRDRAGPIRSRQSGR
jgi:hypothetical protein